MDNNKKINDLIKKINLISEHEFNNKPLTQTDIYHFKKVLYKIESQTNEYNDLINEHKKRREENIKANKEINDYHRKLLKKNILINIINYIKICRSVILWIKMN